MVTVADVDMRNWYEHPDGVVYDGNYPLNARPGAGTLNINDSLHGLASDNMALFSGRQNLLFEDEFETGVVNATYWYQSGNMPVFDQPLNGRNCMRVFLDRDNSITIYRTEVTLKGIPEPYFTDGISAKYGQTYWYAVSIYVPSDFVYETAGVEEIIMQWHGRADSASGELDRNPMLSLVIKDGDYQLTIRGDSAPITVRPTPGYSRENGYTVGTVAPTRGKWTNWAYKVKWGYDNDGDVDLYRDGVLVHSEVNKTNCYNDQEKGGPYYKMGLYKSAWKPDTPTRPDTNMTTRLYHYDNFRLGDSNATLTDVWQDES